ncbi:MAG: RluA family pseudouridine synthase [Bacilli bacterium]|nr:RluA family pseudouridine synthase [Bacilli bacterium]
MKEIIISPLENQQTAFKYVKKYLKDAPLSFIEKLFRKKDVKVNKHWVKKDYLLKTNDLLQIYVKDEQLTEFTKRPRQVAASVKIVVVYEDENILILNKPKGVLVHEDKNEKVNTLANGVITYLTNKGEYSPLFNNAFTPAPCHRLDRNTSGLIVFAKNFESLQAMEKLFKEKSALDKYYLALVVGEVNSNGVVNAPLKKDATSGLVRVAKDGKTAISEYHVVKKLHGYTLLKIHLITGRTHQIRVHMAYIHHPVVGDGKYGDFKVNRDFKAQYKYDTQFLCANELHFDKVTGKLAYLSNKTFHQDLSDKEKAILASL